jgi:3-oxoacyl-[acyl-carrier protein] reductase
MSDISKTAWVTGASGAIGSSIYRELEDHGWNVIQINRNDVNLSDPLALDNWLVSHSYSVPNLIICNAAGNSPKEIVKLKAQDFRFWLENNFLGHVSLIQSVLQEMKSRQSGNIVFISSTFATRSKIGRSQYSVSKAAQDAYMRSLALELAPHGIKVNSVSPGFIDTPLTQKNNSASEISSLIQKIPMGRLGSAVEVAKLVGFLASESNSYITGQNISIDGGFTLQ